MKIVHLAVFAAALALTACGGGGGDSPAPSVAQNPGTVTCPNGTPAATSAACPVVGPATPVNITNLDPASISKGLALSFNGALDPTSVTVQNVVLWLGAIDTGTSVAGNSTLSADGKSIIYTPVQRPAFGQSYTLDAKVKDSVGRSVQWTVPFTTLAMVCANNAIWSNPANFSSVYQNCVADIGIQVQVNAVFNTLQDNTCAVTVGTPLTPACKSYMANGTMLLANTSIVVNGHAVMWMVYSGTDKSDNFVLLDVNDTSNPVPVATFVSPVPLVWVIGNPTGMFVHMSDGKGSQLTVDQNSQVVFSCVLNCLA